MPPQTQDRMTTGQFASWLKKQDPELASFPDAELVKGVLARRPDLQSKIIPDTQQNLPGVPKPTVDMERGGGAAGSALTSFATQLSNLPRSLWESSFFGELGNPRVRAEHEARIKAMEAPGLEGVKNTFQAANPVVTDESGVDVGATVANLLPYLLAVRGFRTQEATAPIRAGARGLEALANQRLVPVRELVKLGTPADEAAAARIRVPGRDVGLKAAQPNMQELTREAIKEGRAAKIPTRIAAEKAAPAPRKVTPPPVRFSVKPAPPAAPEAAAEEGGIEGSLPKGRGRLVKTPEEIQQLEQAYKLQKRLAHERGMAFAGGQVPESGRSVPKTPRPQTTVEWRGLKGPAAESAIDNQVLDALRKHGQRGLVMGLQSLGRTPELAEIPPEQLQAAAARLRDAGLVHGHTAGAGDAVVGIALK